MIGVATAQNTINTVPAIQLGISKFRFIETSHAKIKGWMGFASKALAKKGVKVLTPISLDESIESDFLKIEQMLLSEPDLNVPILWNIGGGQKNHMLGLWEVFKKRKNPLDQVCYSNIQSRSIEFWYWEKDQINHHRIPLDYDDELANYLAVYGFEIKENGEGTLLYTNDKVQNRHEVFDWLKYPEFRTFQSKSFKKLETGSKETFSLDEIKKSLADKSVIEQLGKAVIAKNPILNTTEKINIRPNFISENLINFILSFIRKQILVSERIAPQDFTFSDPELVSKLTEIGVDATLKMNSLSLEKIYGMTSGLFFEQILIAQIQKILEGGNHLVKKAYANVKIKSKDNEAEFDILLLTSLGTLHVLDAKMDVFDKKDENSRKLVLSQAGGAFSSFRPVFSFYPNDMDEEIISPALLQKFRDYSLENADFMVFNSMDFENLKLIINDQPVLFKHFNSLLSHLNLLKN